MKTTLKTVLLGSLLVAASLQSTAMADGTGLYARLEPGVSVLRDIKVSSNAGVDYKLSSKAGFSISGATGYAFSPNWALELESGYSRNNFDTIHDITVSGVTSPVSLKYPGHASLVPIITSLIWSPNLTASVKANLGAGLGAAVVTSESSFGGVHSSTTETAFAGQFRTGFSAAISKNVEANVGYRLCLISDIEKSGVKVQDLVSHTFSAGISVRF